MQASCRVFSEWFYVGLGLVWIGSLFVNKSYGDLKNIHQDKQYFNALKFLIQQVMYDEQMPTF